MSIDKDSVKGISQILSNVRQQSSDPGSSRASQASGWSNVPREPCEQSYDSGYSGALQASGWSSMPSQPRQQSSNPDYSGGALQAPGRSDVPSQPSLSSDRTEHCEWFSIEVDGQTWGSTEPMDQEPQGHPESLPQASEGSMGFGLQVSGPSSATPSSWDLVDPGAPSGATMTATAPQGSPEMDKRLLEELMEARNTNERYKRMLVRKMSVRCICQ